MFTHTLVTRDIYPVVVRAQDNDIQVESQCWCVGPEVDHYDRIWSLYIVSIFIEACASPSSLPLFLSVVLSPPTWTLREARHRVEMQNPVQKEVPSRRHWTMADMRHIRTRKRRPCRYEAWRMMIRMMTWYMYHASVRRPRFDVDVDIILWATDAYTVDREIVPNLNRGRRPIESSYILIYRVRCECVYTCHLYISRRTPWHLGPFLHVDWKNCPRSAAVYDWRALAGTSIKNVCFIYICVHRMIVIVTWISILWMVHAIHSDVHDLSINIHIHIYQNMIRSHLLSSIT